MPGTSFEGRKVIVVGGGGALGGGLVAAFTEAGATVVAADAHLPGEHRRVAGTAYHAVDVTDDGALGAFFDAQPPLWAVINTVGGFAPHTPLSGLDPAELTGQLSLNLVSAALVTKHALRVMKPAGEGRIVHTASRAAVVTKGTGFAYSVSKLGVMHLVSMAAEETRGTKITVNCVVPTIIDTPANRAAMPDADHAAWPKVADIAHSYLFLASPHSHLVSGAAVPV
ncbi:MAG TPA: SDR family oxidoreductase [Streptosporangiaceae bacterium]|jgi:NAD(P)-dependent dehydrogenase (short-subunit alcohol dehydrogenase family)